MCKKLILKSAKLCHIDMYERHRPPFQCPYVKFSQIPASISFIRFCSDYDQDLTLKCHDSKTAKRILLYISKIGGLRLLVFFLKVSKIRSKFN